MKTLEELSEWLKEYREGLRELPDYADLAELCRESEAAKKVQ